MIISGNVLDGECFSYISYLNDYDNYKYNNVYHRSASATTPQACINYCKSIYQEQYTYAGIQSSTCYCGNVPPYMEADYSCTTACSGDSSKTCGGSGSSANWYTVSNQSKFQQNLQIQLIFLKSSCVITVFGKQAMEVISSDI